MSNSSLIDPIPDPKVEGVVVTPDPDPVPAPAQADIPAKLQGKSQEEVTQMYVNLEKEFGRIQNDIGEQRALTDRVLRIEEGRQAAPDPDPVTIDPTDLLEDPVAALDKYFSSREADIRAEYDAKINSLESSLGANSLSANHSDAQTLVNSPEFVEYVQASPLRMRVANAAVAGQDMAALDDLLTDFKAQGQSQSQDPALAVVDPAVAAAQAAQLESSSSGGSQAADTEVFSRTALINLRLDDPEAYGDPAFQARMLKAYAEERVK